MAVTDPNATQPVTPVTVHYRCTCGAELELDQAVGGTCHQCQAEISPKVLGHELAMTMAIHDGSFQLDGTYQRSGPSDQAATVNVRSACSTVNDAELLVGKRFGHFELIAPLGAGGMGQVYRALDTSLQRYVAVKVLRSGIGTRDRAPGSSDREVDKLLQEAVAQARVTHPNIVTIYYVGKEKQDPFLAMELVGGQTLAQRIDQSSVSFEETIRVGQQIAEALKFSYELDIIHGDIKPSNVLLSTTGIAKLSDFGMARRVSQDKDDSVGGTPNYIAPEVLRGGKPSRQSDIYALGVTLYEMTFGELPIVLSGRSVPDWIAVHESSQVKFPTPWPAHLPEKWRTVLEKMLAPEPEQRHANYEELLEDLNSLSRGELVKAHIFPRTVAAGVDWISVMLLAILFRIAFDFGSWEHVFANRPIAMGALQLAELLPIMVYIGLIYFWRQSIGRSLMHIRVVNRYGMPPSRAQMVRRGLLRMQYPLFSTCFLLFQDATESSWGVVFSVFLILSTLFVSLDWVFMFFTRAARSLHDLAVDTRVVLDTH